VVKRKQNCCVAPSSEQEFPFPISESAVRTVGLTFPDTSFLDISVSALGNWVPWALKINERTKILSWSA